MFIYLMTLHFTNIVIFRIGYAADPKTFITLEIFGGGYFFKRKLCLSFT